MDPIIDNQVSLITSDSSNRAAALAGTMQPYGLGARMEEPATASLIEHWSWAPGESVGRCGTTESQCESEPITGIGNGKLSGFDLTLATESDDGLISIAAADSWNTASALFASDSLISPSTGNRFAIQTWASRQGGFWDTQQWMTGDFNGDGRDDLAKAFNDGSQASIDVHLSNGTGFSHQRWATRQGGFWDTQQWVVGDFNGDGRDDLAKAFLDGNQASIDVHLSNGGSFSMQRWATRQGGFWDAQQWVAGDFNGDGRDELAKAFTDGGQASIDVHLSNGTGFSHQRWATRQGGFWNAQQWVVGDFNGDGRDEIAKAFTDGGQASIDVHLSNGGSFSMQRWATRQGGFLDAQQWVAGDFNGDGRDDMAKAFNDGGLTSIDVHPSNGGSFAMQRWTTKQSSFWNTQKWTAGDCDGDGRDDMAKVYNANGSSFSGVASIDIGLSSNNYYGNYNAITGYGEASAERAIERLLSTGIPDLPNQYSGGLYGIDRIGAPEAWSQGYTGQGIVIAVCDTGVDRFHQDLDANIWINSREIPGNGRDDDGNGFADDVNGWNFADNNNNTLDIHGHGTHVGGTIVAERNSFGTTGIAYGAKIMPVKVLSDSGQGTWSSVANGIRYAADNGANIINLSLGSLVSNPTLQNAVAYAWNKGVAVIMAAGNNGGSSPIYPAAYANQWGIAVGAINSSGALASFSNRAGAAQLDYITAAGVTVMSTLPNNQYTAYSGTSMAAPHLAGAMALLMQANHSSGRHLPLSQLESLLTSSASQANQQAAEFATASFRVSSGSDVDALREIHQNKFAANGSNLSDQWSLPLTKTMNGAAFVAGGSRRSTANNLGHRGGRRGDQFNGQFSGQFDALTVIIPHDVSSKWPASHPLGQASSGLWDVGSTGLDQLTGLRAPLAVNEREISPALHRRGRSWRNR
ncbi:MAG: S8 family serine peptidase [Synechococcus sp.]